MRRKTLAALCLAVTLALVACGGSDEKKEKKSKDAPTESVETTEAPSSDDKERDPENPDDKESANKEDDKKLAEKDEQGKETDKEDNAYADALSAWYGLIEKEDYEAAVKQCVIYDSENDTTKPLTEFENAEALAKAIEDGYGNLDYLIGKDLVFALKKSTPFTDGIVSVELDAYADSNKTEVVKTIGSMVTTDGKIVLTAAKFSKNARLPKGYQYEFYGVPLTDLYIADDKSSLEWTEYSLPETFALKTSNDPIAVITAKTEEYGDITVECEALTDDCVQFRVEDEAALKKLEDIKEFTDGALSVGVGYANGTIKEEEVYDKFLPYYIASLNGAADDSVKAKLNVALDDVKAGCITEDLGAKAYNSVLVQKAEIEYAGVHKDDNGLPVCFLAENGSVNIEYDVRYVISRYEGVDLQGKVQGSVKEYTNKKPLVCSDNMILKDGKLYFNSFKTYDTGSKAKNTLLYAFCRAADLK